MVAFSSFIDDGWLDRPGGADSAYMARPFQASKTPTIGNCLIAVGISYEGLNPGPPGIWRSYNNYVHDDWTLIDNSNSVNYGHEVTSAYKVVTPLMASSSIISPFYENVYRCYTAVWEFTGLGNAPVVIHHDGDATDLTSYAYVDKAYDVTADCAAVSFKTGSYPDNIPASITIHERWYVDGGSPCINCFGVRGNAIATHNFYSVGDVLKQTTEWNASGPITSGVVAIAYGELPPPPLPPRLQSKTYTTQSVMTSWDSTLPGQFKTSINGTLNLPIEDT